MTLEGASDPSGHFFSICPEMLFILGGDGALRRLNDPLQRLLGEGAREGTPLAAYLHPDDRRALDVGLAALAEGDAPVRFDCRVRAADGAYQALSFSARRAPLGGEIHGALMQRAARPTPEVAKLEQEGRLLRTFLDNLPLVVCAIDKRGVFTYQDGRALAAAGLRPGQLVGQNIFELYPEEQAQANARAALEGRCVHVVGDAHGVSWETWYIPQRDDKGEVTGGATFTFDLTEVRRAEKELRVQLDLVERQQRVISALSTPIIEVWDKVLTLPMLGVVDSTRAAAVMENLLGQVSRKGARFAILDLTGVDTVDTGTAGHLLKLVQALRLLGAEGIITGIQPQVAQTMVALGLELTDITTCSNLRDGLRLCIRRMREGAA
jgi:rsbT co-antagonist protein RsbR